MLRSCFPKFWRPLESWMSRAWTSRILRRRSSKKVDIPKFTVSTPVDEPTPWKVPSRPNSSRTVGPSSPSSSESLRVDPDGGPGYSTRSRSRSRSRSLRSLRSRFRRGRSASSSSYGTNRESALREKLLDLRKEAPEGSHRYFIPTDALDLLLTAETISEELQTYGFPDDVIRETSETILASASRLFAILVYVRDGGSILDFLREGITDSDLPFDRDDVSSNNRDYKLCSSQYPGQPLKCMIDWDRDYIDEFGRDQWCMLAPVFEYHDRIKHYNLQYNCVLPWVEDEERGDHEIHGGFGSVCKVAIHPAHHRFAESVGLKTLPQFVALKRLHSTSEEDFEAEVAMLKKVQKRKHAHLVSLLATFRYRDHFYLMFPYAHCNLRQYWQHTPTPDFSHATISWVLQQCRFVASALLMVHEAKSTLQFAHGGEEPCSAETSVSRSENESRRYGRHGDIKAENILWFEKENGSPGHLVVADFGLMAFHTKDTRSNEEAKYITGSPSYEPPELQLHSKISRAFDIWCLGCLYLEFITWLVCGWQHLERFPQARDMKGPPSPEFVRDDTFFTMLDDGKRAVVREAVSNWIADLHEMPRASSFVHEFLDLIAEDLLIADPGRRMRIGQVNQHLLDMLSRASRDPAYLTDPKPWPPRAQQAQPYSIASHHWRCRNTAPKVHQGKPLPNRLSGILVKKSPRPSTVSNLPHPPDQPLDSKWGTGN